MKTKLPFLIVLLVSFIFANQLQAQQKAPTKDCMKILVKNLENCNANRATLKGKVLYLRINMESITAMEYQETLNEVESAKQCIANSKAEVAKLEENFPDWFNSPMSSIVVGKQTYTPSWMRYQVAIIVRTYRPIFEEFKEIQMPNTSISWSFPNY